MGKKGVSAAEKRQKMIEMFQSECAVYTSKEVQKHAPKTGIVAGAVEQVLKEVVGDDLVKEAKLGGTLFYWSFPGEAATKKRAELAATSAAIGQLKQQAAALQEQVEQMRKASGQSAEQAAELKEQEGLLNSIRTTEEKKKSELEREKKSASQNMHARKKDVGVLKEAANRWTDILFSLKSELVNGGCEPKYINEMLGTDRIDYIE